MKDFEKTKGMVERWNFLVTCLNNPKASEEETRETIDEMFHLSARFPFETRRELIAIADMKDMQMWFDVWVRILLKLERMRDFLHYDLPQARVQESKLHEHALFQELGKTMKETACDYHLSMPTLPEHFLSPWDIIEAAQAGKNNDVVQLATNQEKAKKKPKKRQKSTFRDIIQHPDVEHVLKRLHFLIDGKSGCKVGYPIRKAWMDKVISKFPSMSEFESEFEIIHTNKDKKSKWEAIRKYFDRERTDYDIKANDYKILD